MEYNSWHVSNAGKTNSSGEKRKLSGCEKGINSMLFLIAQPIEVRVEFKDRGHQDEISLAAFMGRVKIEIF